MKNDDKEDVGTVKEINLGKEYQVMKKVKEPGVRERINLGLLKLGFINFKK